jgi:hypothetical protein
METVYIATKDCNTSPFMSALIKTSVLTKEKYRYTFCIVRGNEYGQLFCHFTSMN